MCCVNRKNALLIRWVVGGYRFECRGVVTSVTITSQAHHNHCYSTITVMAVMVIVGLSDCFCFVPLPEDTILPLLTKALTRARPPARLALVLGPRRQTKRGSDRPRRKEDLVGKNEMMLG